MSNSLQAPSPGVQAPQQPDSDETGADNSAAPAGRSASRLLAALVREARPRQWIKNVLVAAAPGAAGVLLHPAQLGRTALAFAVISLAASGTYYLNDARDVVADRSHPKKRYRPIAAGLIPVRVGYGVAVGLMLLSGLLCVAFSEFQLLGVVAAYLVVTISYTLWLKHEAVLDLATVAAGFVLRAIAGAAACHIPISSWFLIVTSFGSLFMVSGKRYAEFLGMGEDRVLTRASLRAYSAPYLRFVWSLAAAVTIMTYCLWAFEFGQVQAHASASRLSIVPFVIGVLRYAYLVDHGDGGAPEEVVLKDRQLQVIGLSWVAIFLVGVYT